MALTTISSKPHFYRPNTQGQHSSPNIPPPVAAGHDCPPPVKKTLRLMHQRGLFGQDCIQLYFTHLIRNAALSCGGLSRKSRYGQAIDCIRSGAFSSFAGDKPC
jgi:hypothetical protein